MTAGALVTKIEERTEINIDIVLREMNLELTKDGEAWCVHHKINFTNLNDSPVGFGDTPFWALLRYINETEK